jgi:hypothetical protein
VKVQRSRSRSSSSALQAAGWSNAVAVMLYGVMQ